MKTTKNQFDIDFIGEQTSLTKEEEEKALSDYCKQKKESLKLKKKKLLENRKRLLNKSTICQQWFLQFKNNTFTCYKNKKSLDCSRLFFTSISVFSNTLYSHQMLQDIRLLVLQNFHQAHHLLLYGRNCATRTSFDGFQ